MAFRINHNIPALNALRSLHKTDEDMKQTLERLSSGLKINRGADGPAELMISEQMRSQIASVDQAIKNSEASVSMVQTAEATLSELNNLLVSLRQLAIHAANEGANDAKMVMADQNEVENALDTIDRIAQNSQYGTRTLFDGSNGANGLAVGEGLEFISALPITKSSQAEGYAIDITQAATRTEMRGFRPLSVGDFLTPDGTGLGQGFKITLSEGGRNVAFSADSPTDSKAIAGLVAGLSRAGGPSREEVSAALADYVVQRLQNLVKVGGLKLEVLLQPTLEGPVLAVRHREFGSRHLFSVSATRPGLLAAGAHTIEEALPGRDVEGTIDGQTGVGKGQVLSAPINTDAEGLAIKFHSTRIIQRRFPRLVTRGDGRAVPNPILRRPATISPPLPLARFVSKKEDGETVIVSWEAPTDASKEVDGFVHVTQKSLAFQVGPSRGQQVKISLLDARSDQLGRNLPNPSGFESLREIDVTTAQGAQDAMKLIDDARDQISTVRAQLGAFQKNTLESNTNSLRISHENLTSAESSLRDADMAEEMSRLTRNQIMLASGVAMLAQANQTPRSVLQLLNNRQQ